MNFCCFKSPSSWSLVIAAPETNPDCKGHQGPLQGHEPAGEGQKCRFPVFFLHVAQPLGKSAASGTGLRSRRRRTRRSVPTPSPQLGGGQFSCHHTPEKAGAAGSRAFPGHLRPAISRGSSPAKVLSAVGGQQGGSGDLQQQRRSAMTQASGPLRHDFLHLNPQLCFPQQNEQQRGACCGSKAASGPLTCTAPFESPEPAFAFFPLKEIRSSNCKSIRSHDP